MNAPVVIFVCSDGTPDNFVHMEYRPTPKPALNDRRPHGHIHFTQAAQ